MEDTILEDNNGSPVKDTTAFGQKSVISDYTVANTKMHAGKSEEKKKAPLDNASH